MGVRAGRGVPRFILELGNPFQHVRLSKNVDYLIDNLYLMILSCTGKIVNDKARLQKKQLSEARGSAPLKPKNGLNGPPARRTGHSGRIDALWRSEYAARRVLNGGLSVWRKTIWCYGYYGDGATSVYNAALTSTLINTVNTRLGKRRGQQLAPPAGPARPSVK
jgi:hypothetical protein